MKLVIVLIAGILIFAPLNIHAQDSPQIITPENVDQLQLVQTLGRGKALDAQWSPDGAWFGVLTSRGVWLYDGDDLTAEPIQVGDDLVPMTAFTFHPYKNQLVTAQRGNIVFWDIESRSPVREIEGFAGDIDRMVISPDGLRLATQGQNPPMVFTRDYFFDVRAKVILWDLFAGQPIRTMFSMQFHTAGGMEFTPDGRYLLISFYDISDGFYGSELFALESTDGHLIGNVENSTAYDFDLSPNGELILDMGYLYFYIPAEIISLDDLESKLETTIYTKGIYYHAATFTADNENVLLGALFSSQPDHSELLLSAVSDGNYQVIDILSGDIQEIAAHPIQNDGFAVLDKDGIVSFYENFEPVYRFQHYQNPIEELAVTSDGSLIMTLQRLSFDHFHASFGNMETWNSTTSQSTFNSHSEAIGSITISNNDRVAAFGNARGQVFIVDIFTGRLIREVQIFPGCYISDVNFNHDDTYLMVVRGSENRYYDNFEEVVCRTEIEADFLEINPFPNNAVDLNQPPPQPLFPQEAYNSQNLYDSDYNSDSSVVAFATFSSINIWTRNPSLEGEFIQSVSFRGNREDEIMAMDLSSDGHFVLYGGLVDLTVGQAAYVDVIGTGLYRMDTTTFEIERFGDAIIHAVAISPDDRLIAGSEDSVIVIRDAASMDILHTMEAGRANAIQLTADGTKLVIGGEDGVVRIWAVE